MPVVKVDYYTILKVAGTPAFVAHAIQEVALPKGNATSWGNFTANREYSLDLTKGKISFEMEYSSGNFVKFMMWLAAILVSAGIALLLSKWMWRVRDAVVN